MSGPTIVVRPAYPADAEVVVGLVHATFAGRPELDPPATALDETADSVRDALRLHSGLVVEVDGRPAGSLLLEPRGDLLAVRRVGVLADVRHHGVAHRLATAAAETAAVESFTGLVLEARAELPETVRFWLRNGFAEVDRDGPRLTMVRLLPITRTLPEAEDTRALGEQLGKGLGAGDLVVLTGDLGAGKTTLSQGIGAGLGVRGPVTSPTFVISRVHPSLVGGPALIHVDAYRLGDTAELDDLDLDTDIDAAVTIVEWGGGLAEALAPSRLEVQLQRAEDEVRTATLIPVGPRWVRSPLAL